MTLFADDHPGRVIARDDDHEERRTSIAWTAHGRADVTLSLPDERDARGAACAVSCALDNAGDGYTRTGPHVGGWQGKRESAWTFTIMGDDAATAAAVWRAVSAAHRYGCTAVQVEVWDRHGYTVHEVRP